MLHDKKALLLLLILFLLVLASCSTNTKDDPCDPDPTTEACLDSEFPELDSKNFSNSTTINNQWLPRTPGNHYVYEGTTVEDGESIPHRIETTITDLTKVIEDIRTVVVLIKDFAGESDDEELVEAEIAFFAQDDDGNVWNFGEYPEEYEEEELVDAPTWIVGIEDARAGHFMKANPQKGDAYPQGWGPGVEWADRAQVVETGKDNVCVPFKPEPDCFDNVTVIEEFDQAEENAFQVKYYADGVGNIKVGFRGDDTSQEELELVKFEQLSPEDLTKAREEALELEKNAYENSEDVYGQTSPIEQSE